MQTWKRMQTWGAGALIAALLLTACGKDKGTDSGTTAAEETADGWVDFAAGSYTAARTHFLAAISRDDGFADAYNGLGWSQAFLNNLSEAVTAFNNAKTNGLTTPDADAGLAVVYRDLPNYPLAVTSAQAVLTANPSYVFSRLTSLNYEDMRLIMAQAYYRQGEDLFDEAQAQLNILDPANGLNPGNAATWVVDSVTYGTYAEALLMALESVAATLGTP